KRRYDKERDRVKSWDNVLKSADLEIAAHKGEIEKQAIALAIEKERAEKAEAEKEREKAEKEKAMAEIAELKRLLNQK
ncbi:MAG: hypothetical protein LBU62_05790, partial [Bacteroidales bacterium]|nr:hypothetical protein [Bacteroidales bacterium]